MFVQGYYDRIRDKVLVSERLDSGKRVLNEFNPIYEFYIEDPEYGEYTSIYGERCRKLTAHNKNEWYLLKKQYEGVKTYEKNFNIVNKVLYKNYKDAGVPKLHKSFIDIEVDRAGFEYLTIKELIDKACCPVNAVSIYNDWQDKLFTFMLCPETLEFAEAKAICDKFTDCLLFERESDLLSCLMAVMDDSDVICGYNSEAFDNVYITRRIENILGKGQSAGLCLWGIAPTERERIGNFGEKVLIYDFIGKWWADYLILYKKHEQGKKESYSLNSIAELELGEEKVQHDESLEDMYRQRYEDFIKYNRQDTMLVKRLDDKLKFIDIHNAQAHEYCCNIEQTVLTVPWVDTALINEAHEGAPELNLPPMIVPDKVEGKNPEFLSIIPPGAHVPNPKTGLAQWITSVDLNSLYPSADRSMNLSPETIVGQIKLDLTIPYLWTKIEENNLWKNKGQKIPAWGEAWAGDEMWGTLEYQEVMKESDQMLTIKFENGEEHTLTAKQIHDIIWKEGSNLCLSAFGTIFRTDKKGLINRIFTRWYAERKKLKKIMEKNEAMEIGVKIDKDLAEKIKKYL